jgi:hypothetical protein
VKPKVLFIQTNSKHATPLFGRLSTSTKPTVNKVPQLYKLSIRAEDSAAAGDG